MKSSIFLFALLTVLPLALQAESRKNDKYLLKNDVSASAEERWRHVRLFTKDGVHVGEGYVTEGGTLRVDTIYPLVGMKSDLITRRTTMERLPAFKNFCRNVANGFYVIHEDKNEYQLRLKLLRFDKESIMQLRAFDDAHSPVQFWSVDQDIRAELGEFKAVFENGSNTLRYSRHPIYDIQAYIKDQVTSQIRADDGTTEIVLDLSQRDEVVCDWILGLVKMGFEVKLSYPSARMHRQTVVSAEDVRRILAQLQQEFVPQASLIESVALSSAQTALALIDVTGLKVDRLGKDKFLSLWNGLYSPDKNQIRHLREAELKKVSRSLDRLSAGHTNSVSHIMTEFSGVVK